MGLLLSDVIAAVRLAHPAYTRDVVPDRALGDGLGRAQRQLAQAATRVNATYLSQSMTIAFALTQSNAPGLVGAGTTGGLPATLTGGAVTTVEAYTGSLMSYDFTQATLAYGPFAPTSATTLTVTKTGAARTVNGDANRYVWIVDGTGSGPDSIRRIASNTATVWTVSQAFSVTPDTTSVIEIVDLPVELDQQHGVVTGLPAYAKDSAYLVKLDANGSPYLDLSTPLVTKLTTGVTLPPFDRIIGGTVMLSTTTSVNAGVTSFSLSPYEWPFALVHYEGRHSPARWPSGYLLGSTLYFLGTGPDWAGVQNLDLRFVPIPPLFPVDSTALGTYFLLPDTAFEALATAGEVVAATFAQAKGVTVDPGAAQQKAGGAAAAWLKSVGQQTNRMVRAGRRNR